MAPSDDFDGTMRFAMEANCTAWRPPAQFPAMPMAWPIWSVVRPSILPTPAVDPKGQHVPVLFHPWWAISMPTGAATRQATS